MSLGERPLKLIREYSKPRTRPNWRLSRPHFNYTEFYECYRWVLDTPIRKQFPSMYDNHVSLEGYWNKYNTIVWYAQICKICNAELLYKSMNEYMNNKGYCDECHDYICYR
jgi:hypothetical protein